MTNQVHFRTNRLNRHYLIIFRILKHVFFVIHTITQLESHFFSFTITLPFNFQIIKNTNKYPEIVFRNIVTGLPVTSLPVSFLSLFWKTNVAKGNMISLLLFVTEKNFKIIYTQESFYKRNID